MPKQKEIDEVMNEFCEAENFGTSKFPGMTYEQGVQNAIKWMTGEGENPLTD